MPTNSQGGQVKPLSKDQKAQNVIFLKQLRRTWRNASQQIKKEAATLSMKLLEKYIKQVEEGRGLDDKEATELVESRPSAEDLTRQALNILGVDRLHRWVEQDQETKEQNQKDKDAEQRADAERLHVQWVNQRKASEVWMPPPEDVPRKVDNPPRFVFATGGRENPAVPVRSKQVRHWAPSNVDLLRDSGLRVIHVIGKEGQVDPRAKEEAVKQLGEEFKYINRRNFDTDDDYREALKQRSKSQRSSTEAPAGRQAESEAAYRFHIPSACLAWLFSLTEPFFWPGLSPVVWLRDQGMAAAEARSGTRQGVPRTHRFAGRAQDNRRSRDRETGE